MANKKDARRFIRHHSSILITVVPTDGAEFNLQSLHDISAGGLSFSSEKAWKTGTIVSIRFHPPLDFNHEVLSVFSKIIWCRRQQDHYEVGVEFMNPVDNAIDIAHMVEELYRQS